VADGVRPTKRCLDDLDLPFPVLTKSLSLLPHPVIQRAQSIPAEVQAGGVERVRSLSDRIWFKCKVSSYRGIVIRLTASEAEARGLLQAAWWIGAAGTRQDDSSSDFYKQIEAEAGRAGKGTGGPSTEHLLTAGPGEIIWSTIIPPEVQTQILTHLDQQQEAR